MNWFLRSGDRQRKVRRWLRKWRLLVLLLAAAASLVLTQMDLLFVPLVKREAESIDARFRWRGSHPAAPEVALVGVDSSSLNPSNLGDEERAQSEALQLLVERSWPPNRKFFALLIEKLFAAGARVVAVDFVFNSHNEGDAALAAVLEKYADRVVVAGAIQTDTATAQLTFLQPHSGLLAANGREIVGHVMMKPDAVDGVIRRVNLRTSLDREFGVAWASEDDLSSLAALAVEKFTGRRAPARQGQLINFQGPAQTYKYVPVQSVFIGSQLTQAGNSEIRQMFKDKLVFVGPVAEIFQDIHLTPFQEMAGVEIHAQIAGDLLRGTQLREPPGWTAFASATLLSGLAVLIAASVKHAVGQAGLIAGLGAAFFLLAEVLFVEARLVIPVAAPLFALTSTGLFAVLFDFLLEQWERARVRSTLDRYVSKNVAELVLAHADSFEQSLRGEKKSVTTLFSDIRGFTTMTEAADADALVKQLNEYFLKMVDAVLHEGGTLQKFIGDAIMAVWGDTHSLSLEEDAARAVRAGLLMRVRLRELNAGWAGQPDRPPLKTGMGIGHGEVIVGNIGHPLRMEFTVLGDGINTAARLESATKQFGADIMVEAGVHRLTQDKFVYRRVDLLKLKGKTKGLEVFIPLSEIATPPPPWLADYHRAIELYRGRDFTAASALFSTVSEALAGCDFLCEMYLARCRNLLASPPPADWDGSHTLTEK